MSDTIEALTGAKTRRWWQWLLIYPTAGIALMTAAPAWIDRALAVWHNTATDSFRVAEQQNALWRKNLACSARPFNWYHNPRNTRVDAQICPSGDVFVRVSTPDDRTFFEWVDVDSLVTQGQAGGGGLSLIPAAHAATFATRLGPTGPAARQSAGVARLAAADGRPTARIVCQGFLDRRRLRRHVRAPGGCFEEVIDTLNGTVVERRRVPCRTQC